MNEVEQQLQQNPRPTISADDNKQQRIRFKGVCMWFDTKKGFGFISPDDGGENVFAHHTEIHARGFRCLTSGEHVEYEIVYDEKHRVKAGNITGPDGSYVQGPPTQPASVPRKFQNFQNQYNFSAPTYDFLPQHQMEPANSNHSSPLQTHFQYNQYQLSPTLPFIESPTLIYYQQPGTFSPTYSASPFSQPRYEYPSPPLQRNFVSQNSSPYSPKLTTSGLAVPHYLYNTQASLSSPLNMRYKSPVLATTQHPEKQQASPSATIQPPSSLVNPPTTSVQQSASTSASSLQVGSVISSQSGAAAAGGGGGAASSTSTIPSSSQTTAATSGNANIQQQQQVANQQTSINNARSTSQYHQYSNSRGASSIEDILADIPAILFSPLKSESLDWRIVSIFLGNIDKHVDFCSYDYDESLMKKISARQLAGNTFRCVCKSWAAFVQENSSIFYSHITYRKQKIPVTNAQLQSLAKWGQNISVLDLGSCSNLNEFMLSSIPNFFPKVVSLSIHDTSLLSSSNLHAIGTKMLRVSSLSLSNCSTVNDSCFEYLKDLKLKSLNLTNCINVTNNGIEQIATYFPDLISLAISGTKVTDRGVVEMTDRCTKLENIFLSGCKSISRISTTALAEKCNRLKQLDLSYCDKITDSALESLRSGKNLVKLSYLDISHCSQVSDKAVIGLLTDLPALSFIRIPETINLKTLPKSKHSIIHFSQKKNGNTNTTGSQRNGVDKVTVDGNKN